MHFHVRVVDGVFDEVTGGTDADADLQSLPTSVIFGAPKLRFHPARWINETAVAQASLRQRILRAFVGRGLLESLETKDMLAYRHSGFSVDAGVCDNAL